MQIYKVSAMMNLGNICLYAILVCAIVTIVLGIKRNNKAILCCIFQFGLSTLALLKLINIHLNTDYRFMNVIENSHELMPILYKVTGVWANYEGSMLLFLWSFIFVTFIFSQYSKFSRLETVQILIIQSVIILLILSIILLTANPFQAANTIIPYGHGFNPLLQDVGLAIHPPILYLGYAGLSLPFSILIRTIIKTKINITPSYILKAYNWIFASWAFLCAGIGLGSWWAYRELGWGGFWFWDPVENIPLMVWFAATISLHSAKIAYTSNRQSTFVTANILAFVVSIFGMFLVRSGILNSVHSFAADPHRGKVIFCVFSIIALPSVALLITRYSKLQKTGSLTTKILAILTNNFLLSIACIIILSGILYPVFQNVFFENNVSVEASFYQKTLSFISIPMLYIAGIYSCKTKKFSLVNIALSAIIVVCINKYSPVSSTAILLHIHASLFLIISLIHSPNSRNYVMSLGHLGFATIIIGASLYYSYHTTNLTSLKVGETFRTADKSFTLKEIKYSKQDNYFSRTAIIDVKKNDVLLGTLNPETRFYPIEKTFTIESAILHLLNGDIYTTLGELENEKIVIEIQFKPFIYLIWVGVFITFLSFTWHIITRHARITLFSKT